MVEVGADVLGSHRTQGFVTQSVTYYLNVAGAVALGVLVWLHPRLDALLNSDGFRIHDRPGYRRLHQWYLAVSTIQWSVAILLAGLTIWTWKESDAASRESIRH